MAVLTVTILKLTNAIFKKLLFFGMSDFWGKDVYGGFRVVCIIWV